MTIKKCKACKKDIRFNHWREFACHCASCKSNPNVRAKYKKGKNTISRRIYEEYNFKCKKCQKEYSLVLTKNNYLKQYYKKHCSYKCSNSKVQTEEMNRKRSEKLKGTKLSKEIVEKIKKTKNTKEYKEKISKILRISTIKYIEKIKLNGQKFGPCIGKNEKKILDKIEQKNNIKILRQYPIIGYFLDGYCEELNIAFEIDEEHHKQIEEKDMIREGEIKKELNCRFIRINANVEQLGSLVGLNPISERYASSK